MTFISVIVFISKTEIIVPTRAVKINGPGTFVEPIIVLDRWSAVELIGAISNAIEFGTPTVDDDAESPLLDYTNCKSWSEFNKKFTLFEAWTEGNGWSITVYKKVPRSASVPDEARTVNLGEDVDLKNVAESFVQFISQHNPHAAVRSPFE